MRRGTQLTVLIVTLALLAGANAVARGNPAGGDSMEMEGPVELTLLIDNQSTLDGINAVIAAAEDKLGITVTIDLRPGGAEGDNVVKTRLATGEMADLNFYNAGSLFMALNPENNFVDLTDEPFMDGIIDSFKDTVSVNGRVYAAPAGTVMGGGWFYNKGVYEELGLSVPDTWDELVANLQAVKAAGIAPVAASYADSWTAQLLVLADYFNVQHENPNFAADYTANRAGYANTPAALSGFEKLQQVYDLGLLSQDPTATTYEDAIQLLLNGEAAHYPMLTFALGNMASLGPDSIKDIGFFGQPGDDPNAHGLTIWMPAGISVYKEGEHVAHAVEWLSFFASPAGAESWMTAQQPEGPFAIKGVDLPANVYGAVQDMLPYINSGMSAPALEFLSPIKGPNLPQICVQAGLALASAMQSAEEYDRDVEKQAKQLGLPGW